jgi:uncharacterized protein
MTNYILLKENVVIAENIQKADSFIKKMVGLLNRNDLSFDEGLVLEKCNSIHSVGMKFDFDAIYLDNDNKVVRLIENIKPNRIMPIIFKAQKVLETDAGFIQKNNIQIGDQLILKLSSK